MKPIAPAANAAPRAATFAERACAAAGLVRLAAVVALAIGCRSQAPVGRPAFDASTVYEPSRSLGALFHDVQLSTMFPDSKTFVDARPLETPAAIATAYTAERSGPGFSLRAFVDKHFEMPRAAGADFKSDTTLSMEQHAKALWPALTRVPDSSNARSSLLPLPYLYVVPGGRFREVYYWDSYFTMLGLIASGRSDLVRSMLDNFAHLVRTVGHIPNGNRTYYLSRSQPPYFGAMVGLYATATDTGQALRYLDALELEHAFWMEGADRLAPGEAHRRVVRLKSGAVLNRYWDDRADPRPESYRPDYQLGQTVPEPQREVRDIWPWLALAALAVLMLEWGYIHR